MLLWGIFNVTAWESTSLKKWTLSLSLAACLPKDRAMQKAVKHRIDRWRQVCLDATLAKVHSASLRLTALDKNSQTHSTLSTAVLRIVPTATMCGHDPDRQADHGEKPGCGQRDRFAMIKLDIKKSKGGSRS